MNLVYKVGIARILAVIAKINDGLKFYTVTE
jgi:hypothetical protein